MESHSHCSPVEDMDEELQNLLYDKAGSEEEKSESEESSEEMGQQMILVTGQYMDMMKDYHHIYMKILQLEEWKLRNEMLKSDDGLPPGYKPP